MDKEQLRGDFWSSLLPVVLAVLIGWMLVVYIHSVKFLPHGSVLWMLVLFSPVVLFTSVLIQRWDRGLGHVLAALGAMVPLLWVHLTESRAFNNSWIALNFAPDDHTIVAYSRYAQLKISVVAISLVTFIWAVTRLLPTVWRVRNRPINQRTWPAIFIAALCVAYWFVASVFPYRQPMIVDAVSPELSILHVTKQRATFHETRIAVYRDARYYLAKTDRKLFHYSFSETIYEGVLPDGLLENLRNLKSDLELEPTEKTSPKALRRWQAEGWYAEKDNYTISAFTTENQVPPPQELVKFFKEVESVPLIGNGATYEVRDVCLGFCYDPKAGLGYRAENERCRETLDRKELCY